MARKPKSNPMESESKLTDGPPFARSGGWASRRNYIARKIREARRVVRANRGRYPWLEGEEANLTALVGIGKGMARTEEATPNVLMSDGASNER